MCKNIHKSNFLCFVALEDMLKSIVKALLELMRDSKRQPHGNNEKTNFVCETK